MTNKQSSTIAPRIDNLGGLIVSVILGLSGNKDPYIRNTINPRLRQGIHKLSTIHPEMA